MGKPHERIFGYYEVDTNGGCWLWNRSLGRHGYGQAKAGPRPTGAHRLFYERFIGPIPEGAVVMHKCDVTCCVNPDHLVAGTQKENMADSARKGRIVSLRGEDSVNARLTEDIVRAIRADQKTSNCEFGRRLGVHSSVVSRARRGITWGHI